MSREQKNDRPQKRRGRTTSARHAPARSVAGRWQLPGMRRRAPRRNALVGLLYALLVGAVLLFVWVSAGQPLP